VRTAASAGGLTLLVIYLPNFAKVSISSLCVMSPYALGRALALLSAKEKSGDGVTLSTLWESDAAAGLPQSLGEIYLYLLFDIALYLFLGWYFDAIVPSEYSAPRPWYFLFTATFWSGSRNYSDGQNLSELLLRTNKSSSDSDGAEAADVDIEPVPATVAAREWLRVDGISKKFKKAETKKAAARVKVGGSNGTTADDEFLAVDNLSMSLYTDQIYVLLGHNGAGKSTLISMITGLLPPTHGGLSLPKLGLTGDAAIDELRRGLGVCPQHDVLSQYLTVAEHLRLVAGIKGVAEADVQPLIDEKLEALGIADKTNVMVKELSGGMKRKLSVAMSLIGDSKVIFLDEPTSGMDPYSRRRVWALLQEYRKNRVIVVTTHQMDEAELLSDRIGIMSRGKLRCAGTSLFLKTRFASGYHLDIDLDTKALADDADGAKVKAVCAKLAATVHRHVPSATWRLAVGRFDAKKAHVFGVNVDTKSSPSSERSSAAAAVVAIDNDHDERQYVSASGQAGFLLPLAETPTFSDLFDELEEADVRAKLGIVGYGVSLTTMEEVFGNLALEEENELLLADEAAAAAAAGVGVDDDESAASDDFLSLSVGGDVSSDDAAAAAAAAACGVHYDDAVPPHMRYAHCALASEKMQMMALWRFRFIMFKRNKRRVFFQVFMPILFLAATVVLLKAIGGPPSGVVQPGKVDLTLERAVGEGAAAVAVFAAYFTNTPFPYFLKGTEGRGGSAAAERETAEALLTAAVLPPDAGMRYVDAHRDGLSVANLDMLAADGQNVTTYAAVGAKRGPTNSTLEVDAVYNELGVHVMPTLMSTLLNAAYKVTADETAAPVLSVSVTSEPLPFVEKVDDFRKTAAPTVLVIMSGSAYFFATMAFGSVPVQEREKHFRHMLTVTGVTPKTYWLSLFAADFTLYMVVTVLFSLVLFVATNQELLLGTNTLLTVVALVMYGVMRIPFFYLLSRPFKKYETFLSVVGPGASIVSQLLFGGLVASKFALGESATTWLGTLFSMYPPLGIMWALFQTTSPSISTIIDFSGERTQLSPFAFDVAGGPILAMVLTTVLCAWATYALDMRQLQKPAVVVNEDSFQGEDVDVVNERQRVEPNGDAADALSLVRVGKTYPAGSDKNKGPVTAVHCLSVGVPKNQCLALLGPNGAGKTSTMGMITGDIAPSCGRAIVADDGARSVGLCPQFNGLSEYLTGRELLVLFGHLKGVPANKCREVATAYMRQLGFAEHADKQTRLYSGGTQRKLSIALALVGGSHVVLLDEPTVSCFILLLPVIGFGRVTLMFPLSTLIQSLTAC
jgi:ATP-binding cassette subfamily A (ABC1) protein 3